MDFGKSFSYPFEDQDWLKKVGIAALFSLLPGPGTLVVMGYGSEIIKRTIRKDAMLLPDWDGVDGIIEYLLNGLKLLLIGFVYALPLILFSACGSGSAFWESNGSDGLRIVAITVSACLSCLGLLYGLLMGMVLPAAIGRFVDKDDLKAAFQFREVFGLVRAAPGAFALTLLIGIISSFIASLGAIACLIGAAATSAYAAIVYAQFQGQAYLAALEAGGAAAAGDDFPPAPAPEPAPQPEPDLEPEPAYDPDATAIYNPDVDGEIEIPEE